MGMTLATGTTISVAKTYGAPVALSAATNSATAGFAATTSMTTGSAHGFVSGDYVEITSSWGRLNQRIARCTTGTTGSTVVLENVDTFDTGKFPSGTGGTGSLRKITAWTALSQLKSLSSGGGDMQSADATSLDDVVEKKIPTIRSAVTMDVEVYDDPTLAWYADVTVASDSMKPYGLMITPPNNARIVANAYWSLSKVPMVSKNEVITTKLSLSYASDPIRYTS